MIAAAIASMSIGCGKLELAFDLGVEEGEVLVLARSDLAVALAPDDSGYGWVLLDRAGPKEPAFERPSAFTRFDPRLDFDPEVGFDAWVIPKVNGWKPDRTWLFRMRHLARGPIASHGNCGRCSTPYVYQGEPAHLARSGESCPIASLARRGGRYREEDAVIRLAADPPDARELCSGYVLEAPSGELCDDRYGRLESCESSVARLSFDGDIITRRVGD